MYHTFRRNGKIGFSTVSDKLAVDVCACREYVVDRKPENDTLGWERCLDEWIVAVKHTRAMQRFTECFEQFNFLCNHFSLEKKSRHAEFEIQFHLHIDVLRVKMYELCVLEVCLVQIMCNFAVLHIQLVRSMSFPVREQTYISLECNSCDFNRQIHK